MLYGGESAKKQHAHGMHFSLSGESECMPNHRLSYTGSLGLGQKPDSSHLQGITLTAKAQLYVHVLAHSAQLQHSYVNAENFNIDQTKASTIDY